MKKIIKFNVVMILLVISFYFGLYGYAKLIKKIEIKKENNYYM